MATRATQQLCPEDIQTAVVASGQVVTAKKPIKYASADGEILDVAATTDLARGIALDSGTAGQTVRYVKLGGSSIVPCLVATAATRGKIAVYGSGGATDATPGGGTTFAMGLGQWVESGVTGDTCGLDVGMAGPIVTA